MAIAAGPRSRWQCLQRFVGQLLIEDMTNRPPQRGQRKRKSANHVAAAPTQHTANPRKNTEIRMARAIGFSWPLNANCGMPKTANAATDPR